MAKMVFVRAAALLKSHKEMLISSYINAEIALSNFLKLEQLSKIEQNDSSAKNLSSCEH
jgi:hypothetical protein